MHLCDARISKLADNLSQDFNTPLSAFLAVVQKLLPGATTIPIGPGHHQLTSVPGLGSRNHFRWITPTLADIVPVDTRVSLNLADHDRSLLCRSLTFIPIRDSTSTVVPSPETYDSGSTGKVVTVQVRGCYSWGGGGIAGTFSTRQLGIWT